MAAIAAAISSQTLKALLAPRSSWTTKGVSRVVAAACHIPPPPNSSIAEPQRSGSATIVGQSRQLRSKRPGSAFSVRCFSALSPETKSQIDKIVQSHKVVLFMKGNRYFPQCDLSDTVMQILNSLNVQFVILNVLMSDKMRQGMKEYSNWPTCPQLYVNGEFFGGGDITVEAYKSGELKKQLDKASSS